VSNRLSLIWIAILALGILAASEAPAHAYIDPGTGSYLLQLAIGSILGGLFVVKMYWKRLTAPLRRKKTDEDAQDED
jgi:hydrogenase-4 membrane subunit HyfE